MSDNFEKEQNPDEFIIEHEQWWLTIFHRQLVWARLRVFDSGIAHVFGEVASPNFIPLICHLGKIGARIYSYLFQARGTDLSAEAAAFDHSAFG